MCVVVGLYYPKCLIRSGLCLCLGLSRNKVKYSGVPSKSAARGGDLECRPFGKKMSTAATKNSDDLVFVISLNFTFFSLLNVYHRHRKFCPPFGKRIVLCFDSVAYRPIGNTSGPWRCVCWFNSL